MQKLCSTPVPRVNRLLERPPSQERKGKDRGEPALKKALRTSVGALLVSESDTEETEESKVGILPGEDENPSHTIPRQ